MKEKGPARRLTLSNANGESIEVQILINSHDPDTPVLLSTV